MTRTESSIIKSTKTMQKKFKLLVISVIINKCEYSPRSIYPTARSKQ